MDEVFDGTRSARRWGWFRAQPLLVRDGIAVKLARMVVGEQGAIAE
jgi:hypothetical protein